MREFYDPRIATDYPAYFCRGVQQAANLLHRLSSKYYNGDTRNKYKLKTSDYLIKGSSSKISQWLDRDYDFNAHTVNEMFEFLCVLYHINVVKNFGENEIELNRSQIELLEKIGEGYCSEEIYQQIQKFDFTSHAKTNGFRVHRWPNINETN
ncbi:hypothetical protein A2T98_06750 [Nodularia spumigena CENA596]|uniref:Uncharacterized protein n=1 Tax=Nodularia spumigena CENA596 TaxID=1819295 RepID=A0A161VTG8_NODSP|nr:hypothetical protein [Nodularia spumigena]KZL50565.1 hypothetical protein A2T98_06750 [Nodularia spumigena CENA596]